MDELIQATGLGEATVYRPTLARTTRRSQAELAALRELAAGHGQPAPGAAGKA